MKLIDCPLLGLRPASEFAYGGPWRPMPDPDSVDNRAWAAWVFHRDGAPGLKRELWYHTPSGLWFMAERDTLTDEFQRVVTLSEAMAEGAGNA